MLPPLIALTGYKRSGKDSVALALRPWDYDRAAIADPLREIARTIGWDGSKAVRAPCPQCGTLRGRELLQTLGTEGIREHVWQEIWIDVLKRRIEGKPRVVVTDVRLPNEAQAIRSWGGVVWRVERTGCGPDAHATEQGVDAIAPDAWIRNDGSLDDLSRAVNEALHYAVRKP